MYKEYIRIVLDYQIHIQEIAIQAVVLIQVKVHSAHGNVKMAVKAG